MVKVILSYPYRGEIRSKEIDVQEVIEAIRDGKYAKSIEIMREDIRIMAGIGSEVTVESAAKVPAVMWSQDANGYNGLVLLSLHVKDERQLAELRKSVNMNINVLCSFCGSSGKTLKVLMMGQNADGRTMSEEAQRAFHSMAYCRMAAFMLAVTGISSTGKGNTIDGGCRISHDAEVYYNPNALPLMMEATEEEPSEVLTGKDITELAPRSNVLPGYSDLEMAVTNFNHVRRQVDAEGSDDLDNDCTYIIRLAEACAKAGIEEEVAVKCTLSMNVFSGKTLMVRTSFERAYAEQKPRKKPVISKNVLLMELMQHFLTARYRFRQNEVTGSVEYAEIGKYVASWKPFTERERNRVCIEAQKAGIDIWDKDLSRYVNSTLVETFDPLAEWLMTLPKWDGGDRVGELAATVKTDWEEWPEMFRLWMRSMVTQWKGINRMYGATMVLMFTGRQGVRKSTFFKRLLPKELAAYYVDRIDFTNKKDAERALIRFCLINLDEFDQISPRQTAFLKHMLQKSDVTYRKMYENDIEQRRRYAAFCATTNSEAPLTDLTGSRRYLVVEVQEPIDVSQEIDYGQLYAQVLTEIRNDEPLYFDAEKERIIQEHNRNYTEDLPLIAMFENTFAIPKAGEKGEELTSTEILLELKERYKTAISINRSTTTQLGKYLGSKGIRSELKDRRRVFRLIRR